MMNKEKILLFLIGCIGTRFFLVYLAKTMNKDYLPLMGIFTLAISIGLFYYFFSGTRTTGPETFGQKIWWNNLRPVHAILYLLFSIYAFNKNNNAWVFLMIDVLLGLGSFLIFHYRNGDFSQK